jgi:hypothetical protein
MNTSDIPKLRLQNQHLIGKKCKTPEEVATELGAVQAQDYAAVKWGVGLRMETATDDIIEKAYNEGKILRTHVMRPTWHLITPENIRWMQELTSSRVKQLMNTYNKKLELTDALFAKSNKAVTKALKGKNYLTRQELKKILEEIGIKTDVQRLAHIIMYAELDSLIVNGPRKGKQFTYALLDERVPLAKPIPRDEALSKLTLRYFKSHGPAQLRDFSWWSGLTMKDAAEGISMMKSKLHEETIDGKTYLCAKNSPISPNLLPVTCHLLSIYDEYTIAYKDRSALGGERYVEKFISMGNTLTSVLVLDGLLVGTWKRVFKKGAVEVSVKPLRPLTKSEKESVSREVQRYGKFLQMQTTFTIL